MTDAGPIMFAWDGEAMTPAGQGWARRADKTYLVGERYSLVQQEERSVASHRQFFASLNEAWNQLPEGYAEHFPTAEHLRKYCLIKAGYADERSQPCSSRAEALRFAAFLKPIDTYAIVIVDGSTVKMFTAQSQSMRAMGKKPFQDSKQKVLEIAWGMVGLSPQDAAQHVGRAA